MWPIPPHLALAFLQVQKTLVKQNLNVNGPQKKFTPSLIDNFCLPPSLKTCLFSQNYFHVKCLHRSDFSSI